MSSVMLKYYPSTTTTSKSFSQHQRKPRTRGRHKCTCRNNNIMASSSCGSVSTEHSQQANFASKRSKFRPGARHLQQTPMQKVIIQNNTDEQLRSRPLQTEIRNRPMKTVKSAQGFNKLYNPLDQQPRRDYLLGNNLNFVASSEDQFYSCNSDDSEANDTSEVWTGSQNRSNTDKNHIILKLLHEVENLINTDHPKKPEPAEYSSKDATQGLNGKVSKCTSTTQLDSQTWPPPPGFYNDHPYMQPDNSSIFPPYNLGTPALTASELPEPFVYEEDNKVRDAYNCNKSALTTDQLADNICLKALDPLEYTIEAPCLSLTTGNKFNMNVSIHTSTSLCLQEDVGPECGGFIIQSFSEKTDSFKDCYSYEDSRLVINQLPAQFICRCVCDQPQYGARNGSFLLSCAAVRDGKLNGPSNLTGTTDDCPKDNSLNTQIDRNPDLSPLDDNLQSYYVNNEYEEPLESKASVSKSDDKNPVLEKSSKEEVCAEVEESSSCEIYECCVLCVSEDDDEEPTYRNCFETVQHLIPKILDREKFSGLCKKPAAELEIDENVNCKSQNESQDLQNCIEKADTENLEACSELQELLNSMEKSDSEYLNKCEELSEATDDAEKPLDKSQKCGGSPDSEDYTLSETSKCDSKQLLSSCEEDQQELAKKKCAEKHIRNLKERLKEAEFEKSSAEIKYFIDFLILDLEALDFARHKPQLVKNFCKSKELSHCIRDNFPVTITEVSDLGASSLYVKWKIHDCFGIGGYEIYTDGYLTNRFYNGRHNAAVVTNVDITLPHRITLVAQPKASGRNIDFNCNMSKKCSNSEMSPWSTAANNQRQLGDALWTPSIFLYEPSLKSSCTNICKERY